MGATQDCSVCHPYSETLYDGLHPRMVMQSRNVDEKKYSKWRNGRAED